MLFVIRSDRKPEHGRLLSFDKLKKENPFPGSFVASQSSVFWTRRYRSSIREMRQSPNISAHASGNTQRKRLQSVAMKR